MIKKLLPLLFLFASLQAEQKPFVIVIPSHNNQEWVQQNLDSVFSQKYDNYRVVYISDASTDETDKRVEQYIAENRLEDKITFFKNKEQRGALACMCQAIFPCSKQEIIVDLEGCDWLAHEEVLSHLNAVYADPSVWMTYGQFVYYPSFTQGFASPIPEYTLNNNAFRNLTGYVSHLRTFYAALFHEIDKQDFLDEGNFFQAAGDLAYLLPLLEMAGTHTRFIADLLYIFNYTFPASDDRAGSALVVKTDQKIRAKNAYFPLPELPIDATCPPASIYRHIEDLSHPTENDYRFVQTYLQYGMRTNLERLGAMQGGMRAVKIIGNSPEETPSTGSAYVNSSSDARENCVILYSTFNRNYPKGLKRLLEHIVHSDFKGHVLYRMGGWPDEEGGSLKLAHVPYAFKSCFFKEAERLGYKRVLWLDSAVLPVISLNEIFAMIEEKGYFIMGNSHPIGPFMTSQAAAYFGLTLEQTHHIPSCSAGLFGLDLTQKKPRLLLDLWYRAAFDKDAFFSPRSDQNALSILLHQFQFTDLTDISRMPHAETGDAIKPDSLFYLDRIFIQ